MFLKLEYDGNIKKTKLKPEHKDLSTFKTYASSICKIPAQELEIQWCDSPTPTLLSTQQQFSDIINKLEQDKSQFFRVRLFKKGEQLKKPDNEFINMTLDEGVDSTKFIKDETPLIQPILARDELPPPITQPTEKQSIETSKPLLNSNADPQQTAPPLIDALFNENKASIPKEPLLPNSTEQQIPKPLTSVKIVKVNQPKGDNDPVDCQSPCRSVWLEVSTNNDKPQDTKTREVALQTEEENVAAAEKKAQKQEENVEAVYNKACQEEAERKKKRKEMKDLQVKLMMDKIIQLEEKMVNIQNTSFDQSFRIEQKWTEESHKSTLLPDAYLCSNCFQNILGAAYVCCFCKWDLRCEDCGSGKHAHPQLRLPVLPSSRAYLLTLVNNMKKGFEIDPNSFVKPCTPAPAPPCPAPMMSCDKFKKKTQNEEDKNRKERFDLIKFMTNGQMPPNEILAFIEDHKEFSMEDFLMVAHTQLQPPAN